MAEQTQLLNNNSIKNQIKSRVGLFLNKSKWLSLANIYASFLWLCVQMLTTETVILSRTNTLPWIKSIRLHVCTRLQHCIHFTLCSFSPSFSQSLNLEKILPLFFALVLPIPCLLLLFGLFVFIAVHTVGGKRNFPFLLMANQCLTANSETQWTSCVTNTSARWLESICLYNNNLRVMPSCPSRLL